MKKPVNAKLMLFIYILGIGIYSEKTFAAEEKINEEIPSLEFLEFLGSFETENGQWIDPMEIENLLKLSAQNVKTEESNDEKTITR